MGNRLVALCQEPDNGRLKFLTRKKFIWTSSGQSGAVDRPGSFFVTPCTLHNKRRPISHFAAKKSGQKQAQIVQLKAQTEFYTSEKMAVSSRIQSLIQFVKKRTLTFSPCIICLHETLIAHSCPAFTESCSWSVFQWSGNSISVMTNRNQSSFHSKLHSKDDNLGKTCRTFVCLQHFFILSTVHSQAQTSQTDDGGGLR